MCNVYVACKTTVWQNVIKVCTVDYELKIFNNKYIKILWIKNQQI